MMRNLLAGALATWLAAVSALAGGTRDLAREAQIEKDLGQIHPDLVEPFRAARVAFDTEDYAEASRLLREIIAKAPDYDVAYRRLGSCLVQQEKRAEGLELCEKALALNRSPENLTTLAHSLVWEQKGSEHRAEYERALSLLLECRTQERPLDAGTLALTAQVALVLDNRAEFHAATAMLAAKYPNEMTTHYCLAIQAAFHEQWVRAEKEIRAAEKLGLKRETAQRFLAGGVHSRAVWSRTVSGVLLAVGLWAGGLVLLFGLGFLLSRLTLGQIHQADPQTTVSTGEQFIRKIYRVVLNFAGVYYYLSLPIVCVLVVGVVAAALYACLMVGRIPIKLMFLLVIGAIFTIIAMVKSLLLRIKAEDPGRPLQRSEAEELWELTEEVAQSVGTRPIDEIRITPGTDLAVYEHGTWRQKLRNQARRVLILGTGVLNGFKQDDFRCVLAHEYGHFSHRDTAGGDIALRVRNDMLKFFVAMVQAGQATYINVAFHFLRLYHLIFRRISHGATRLQEVLADRVAAQIYGAPAFESGLTHVIRRSLEFEAAANVEIKQSLQARRPLQNLYELPAPPGSEVALELQKALGRQTSADDTHPSPRDRFQLVARLQQPSVGPRTGEVWELFNDPAAIRREMVAQVEQNVAPHRQRAS